MEGPGSGDSGSPRGDAPALLPPAPPALPAPSAGDPAAPLSPPPPSSPSPGPPGRVVWADLAEDADRAAGRPVECRDRVPPPAPARPPLSRSAGGLTPGGGSSAARARTRPPRRLPCAPPGIGEKAKDLGPGIGRRRRRNAGWGVAGRADFGPARSSWCSSGRLALARPAAPPPPPQVVGSPALSRHSPFRPFIAFFGSSRLCCSTSPRRPALPRPPPSPAVGRLTRAGVGWGCPSRARGSRPWAGPPDSGLAAWSGPAPLPALAVWPA
nr:formin-like protein 14 [Aegilops tauschii subsp. strangulata]